MTEEEINKIADIVSKKVIEVMEAKQKAWDEAYHEEMKAQGFELVDNHFEGIIPAANKLIELEAKLSEQKDLLSNAIQDEDYQFCSVIKNRIAKINEDIINYKRNTNNNR
jgi:hypothetical protein